MSLKPLDDLVPGMFVSQDVRSTDGRLLLPAGTVLVQHHLDVLRQWQVVAVQVGVAGEGASVPAGGIAASPDPASHTRHERHLNDVFRLVDRSDPVMGAFFRFLLERMDHADSQAGS